MPNWCNNQASITFKTPKETDKFLKVCAYKAERAVPGTLFDTEPEQTLFHHYYPEPQNTEGEWYNWRIANWGTKWAPDIDNVVRVDNIRVNISFQSAWAPPQEWFENCGKRHGWEWELEYIEMGMAFAGSAEGDGTGILHQDSFNDPDPRYREIADHFGFDFEDEDEDTGPTP